MVVLGDMKSCVVVLSMDSWGMRESKIKAKYNQQAREREVGVLERCAVHDVWDIVHGERDDRPPGYTFNCKQAGDPKWRPRRLDGVHVSTTLRNFVLGAYVCAHVPSDHRAVIVQVSPPKVNRVLPRFRFPLEMLLDPGDKEMLTNKLEQLLSMATQDDVEAWCTMARHNLTKMGISWRRMRRAQCTAATLRHHADGVAGARAPGGLGFFGTTAMCARLGARGVQKCCQDFTRRTWSVYR